MVEGVEEGGVDDDGVGWIEHAHFVFESVEVDACLASHAGVDHGEECGGDVDVGDASLEGAGGESAEVGDHAAAEVEEEAVACAAAAAELCPYGGEGGEGLMGVGGGYDNVDGVLHEGVLLYEGEAQAVGCFVGEEEELVVWYAADGVGQALLYVGGDDDFVWHGFLSFFVYGGVMGELWRRM